MTSDMPRVTCLCYLTDTAWLQTAIQSYEHQSYENKELVLVSYLDSIDVKRDDIIYVKSKGDTIGEIKNQGLSHASGDIIINWEQKSISHQDRIYKQLLGIAHSNADVVLLSDIKICKSTANGDFADRITNQGNAILETIAYIRHPELKYPNINLGLELSILELAHKLQFGLISIPGYELYTKY